MSEPKSKNLTWHEGQVSRQDREKKLGQKGCTVWLTGLSGSGKSTLLKAIVGPEASGVQPSSGQIHLDGIKRKSAGKDRAKVVAFLPQNLPETHPEPPKTFPQTTPGSQERILEDFFDF